MRLIKKYEPGSKMSSPTEISDEYVLVNYPIRDDVPQYMDEDQIEHGIHYWFMKGNKQNVEMYKKYLQLARANAQGPKQKVSKKKTNNAAPSANSSAHNEVTTPPITQTSARPVSTEELPVVVHKPITVTAPHQNNDIYTENSNPWMPTNEVPIVMSPYHAYITEPVPILNSDLVTKVSYPTTPSVFDNDIMNIINGISDKEYAKVYQDKQLYPQQQGNGQLPFDKYQKLQLYKNLPQYSSLPYYTLINPITYEIN